MGETIPDVSRRRARHGAVSWHEEAGRVVVVRQRFGKAGAAVVRALGSDPDLTVKLDPLGSAAWKLMDGRTVAEIRTELGRLFPGQDDLTPRLGRFLGVMVSKGLVVLD